MVAGCGRAGFDAVVSAGDTATVASDAGPSGDGAGSVDDDAGLGADDAGTTTGARFFRSDSLWNTPIAAQTVSWRDEPKMRAGSWSVSRDSYSTPVVFSQPSDPIVDVTVPGSWGWSAGVVQLRIPAGVTGSPDANGALVVVDGTTAYDFFVFNRASDTSATAQARGQSDIVTGSGWGSPSPSQGAGTYGAGSNGLAGLVMGHELTEGLRHALAVGMTGQVLAQGFVPPAIAGDGAGGGSIPEGSRLGIPPDIARPAGLSPQGNSLWEALQTYGGWVVQQEGGSAPGVFHCDPNSVSDGDLDAFLGALDSITPHLRVVVYDYPYDA